MSLVDRVSGPASKVIARIDEINQRTQKGMQNIVAGGAGLFAIARTLQSILQPVVEMDRAIGEVASLDVGEDVLKKLERTALKFSVQWGESATDFVSSAYDIQSAIGGLSGNELAAFTESSGVLAKATKADAGTITNFMGTMFGIFKNNADAIGRENWVKVLTGQTASAVRMFKTTGAEMSAAFTSVGAEAASMGISMGEQMAVLGTLQATMSGSEAGTKYLSFLQGIGKAQTELGLSFTDSQGRMLPMIDILGKIRGKFGEIDTVAKADLLKKAFGRKEAVAMIKLLMNDVNGLNKSISDLENVSGMKAATDMAQAMVDPLERLQHAGRAVSISFGRALQPALEPLIESLTNGANTIVRWTELFPNVTRWVGYGTLAVFGLVGAASALALVGGVAQLTMAGWGVVAGMAGMFKTFVTALKSATIATWLFNTALWANPIMWIVGAVILLMGVLAAAVIYWDDITLAVSNFTSKALVWMKDGWQSLKATFLNNGWMQIVFYPLWLGIQAVDYLIDNFDRILVWWDDFSESLAALIPTEKIANVFDGILQHWNQLKAALLDNEWIQRIFLPIRLGIEWVKQAINAFQKIPAWWADFKNWLLNLNPFSILENFANGLAETLNWLPGIQIGNIDEEKQSVNESLTSLNESRRIENANQGSVINQIVSATTQTDSGIRIDNLEIKTDKVDQQFFEDELAMVAG